VRCVPDYESSKAAIPDQHVGAESEHEVRHSSGSRREHGIRKRVRGGSFEEEVGWASDLEGRVRRKRLVSPEMAGVEIGRE
jgi:hypothetical protein